jgi:hypothetical protein
MRPSSVPARRHLLHLSSTLPHSPFWWTPSLATDVRDLWVDVNTTFDQNYGKSIVFTSDPFPSIGLLQKSKVIFRLDNARFNALYADFVDPSGSREGLAVGLTYDYARGEIRGR